MARIKGLTAALSAAAILAACSTPEETPMSSNTYNRALGAGYQDLAEKEQAEFDWQSSRHFAQKAAAADSDIQVDPDAVEFRRIPAEYQDEMSSARVRLVAARNAGAVEAAPVEVATAQIMFDCWLQEREENHQEFDIARCEEGFQTAMANVDAIMAGPEASPYNVFFDFSEYVLTDDAQAVLGTILSTIEKTPNAKITVAGHTDTVGSADFNLALSQRRAEAVAEFLVKNGVPESAITTVARGQTGLLVPTADGVYNAQNRRSNITIQ